MPSSSATLPASWPRLRTYEGEALARVALPVGGVGTGTVSFCGWGAWRHWEVANRPAKGFTPVGQGRAAPFFAVRAARTGKAPVTRLLEGPLPAAEWDGPEGATMPNAGLPRFRDARFHAAYPLGQLELRDPDVPVRVRLNVFNPLIPGDAERSGLPVALVRVHLSNPGRQPVRAAVAAALPNFIGMDGWEQRLDPFRGRLDPAGARGNVNTWREDDGLRGLALHSTGVAPHHPAGGSLALATTARRGVSHRTAWADLTWSDALLEFWDDFAADGRLEERAAATDTPTASLAVEVNLPPGARRTVDFILAWHFPHRPAWGHGEEAHPPHVGNYYTTRWPDAWAAATHAARHWSGLERDTVRFVETLVQSDLPAEIREAALFNLSTLRSQTCFRAADGRFFGWEGCFDRTGSCHGNCTHVWNYEHATAHLFPDLARSMRETEFSDHAMYPDGLMGFRVALPLGPADELHRLAAADGQMGCLLKLHREWRLSGDTAWLCRLWPHARRALEFAWLPGGWDADQDGVMEGCQHNTMDVEYFGPNPQMATWYLGALRASAAMARAMGEPAFAAKCDSLFARGRIWVDRHLFNGDYYEHEIRPVATWDEVRPGLAVGLGTKDPSNPALQLGAGCLVDQLAGQVNAHFEDFGHLLDPGQQRKTLRSVLRFNRRHGFHGHFNHMRAYALGDDTALLMASYPRGRRPARPFPYFTEVMTGFEYCVAVHLLQEGLREEARSVVRDIRARYDGVRRNPFDEAECGHHYARALASWGLVAAYPGINYCGLRHALLLRADLPPGRWPWVLGGRWGRLHVRRSRGRVRLQLQVHGGVLSLRAVRVGEVEHPLPRRRRLRAGQALVITLPAS